MSGPDSVHPNRTYCSYSSLMGSDWELNFICCESNPLKCPVVSLIVIDAIVILGAIELYWSPILAFTFHLCFSAAKIRLEVTELCSVQIFQLRVAFCALSWMDLEFPSCQKKSSMSHSSSVHEEESGYDGPPLCVYSHHICCSLSLFGRNESKCYLHNLPSCYLQIYDVSITWNNCLMWLQSTVCFMYQLLIHRRSWENSPFVSYWAKAQLLVEEKMGHDGGFLWCKFVMGDEHNWLAEVKGGNQNIFSNHCSFKLTMDKSLWSVS